MNPCAAPASSMWRSPRAADSAVRKALRLRRDGVQRPSLLGGVDGTYYDDQRGLMTSEPGYFDDTARGAGAGAGKPPYDAISGIDFRTTNCTASGMATHRSGLSARCENSWYIRVFDAGYTEQYIRPYLHLTPDGNTVLNPCGTIQRHAQRPGAIPRTCATSGRLRGTEFSSSRQECHWRQYARLRSASPRGPGTSLRREFQYTYMPPGRLEHRLYLHLSGRAYPETDGCGRELS